jgi:hypothetical protein
VVIRSHSAITSMVISFLEAGVITSSAPDVTMPAAPSVIWHENAAGWMSISPPWR